MAVNQPNQIEPLREALRLASHGVKVIQIHAPTRRGCSCGRKKCGKSIGKHPLLEAWAEHATADSDTIRRMWEKKPWANVGVPMGNVNGLFAIDVDGPEGQETLQKWIQEHGELPATWQVMTGGGGMQMWYRVPKGIEIPNSVKKIGINVDIRGTGGQSVAPGSLHQSGSRYRWAPTRRPEDLKPADPPEWLVDKIREVIADQQQAKLAKIQTEEIHLSLSPKQWWAEWFSVHRREMMDPDFPRKLRGPWAKMPNQLARMALILHMTRVVCGEVEGNELDEISLHRGVQLVRYFKSHIRKAYNQLGKSLADKRIEEAVEWIRKRGGTVKRRDIVSYRVADCRKNSDADTLFEELTDCGYGVVKNQKPPRGGRTTVMFCLNDC
ncbi:hypothetical protein GCM10007416_00480 [Kroppenstedtia guangzhouensis]|uniref:DNA primase/polymerase bifunctional N-terminal domain-containing protein n=1 Tax=Kroppenstedtia guangzhouensis TaxID=1274356 RepID=A0ABQ1FVE1_9BACL|nr:bifunctional DNA primase/polymerase [Kroppenstedtia guangzhouensis]GGA31864.1 hypothetical protein GCM10007416_00480 [Kroppenstedtia guangzhouensis]